MRKEYNLTTGEVTEYADAHITLPTPEQLQQTINQEALAYLSSTDWLLWRELDGGTAMPTNIKQLRVEARAKVVV